MPSRYPSPLTVIYWLTLCAALIISFVIFKDLADISQWIVQSERSTTMWVWYNRWPLTYTTLCCITIVSIMRFSKLVSSSGLLFYGALTIIMFNMFSGMLNPHLMMRERMHDGQFVSIDEASHYLSPEESVIVFEVNGNARAHSDRHMLRPHVAGNGEWQGNHVVMTYCGLTNLGMAFSPYIEGKAVDLAPITQLHNNLILWDKNSDEPIQQLWGKKERDVVQQREASMQQWPTFRMPFERFKQAYPNGEVFINDYIASDIRPTFLENPFLAIYDPLMDFIFNHAVDYQAKNEDPTFPTVSYNDKRLPAKEKIWGFNVNDDYVVYTEEFVQSFRKPINVEVGGQAIVVNYDQDYESLGIFYNPHNSDVSKVDFFGESDVGKLERVETVKAGAYWIIWAEFFPNSKVNPT